MAVAWWRGVRYVWAPHARRPLGARPTTPRSALRPLPRDLPSRLAAAGPLKELLGAVPPLNDLPGRLFQRPEFLFPSPEKLFSETSLRDWVLDKELVVQNFEWEAVIMLSILVVAVGQWNSRSDSEEGRMETSQTDDANELSRRALVRQEEELFEKSRGLAWLAGVTVAFLWIGGILNHDNALMP